MSDEHWPATSGSAQQAGFTDLVGQWTPDPQFEEIVESLRRIDTEKWI